MSQITYKQFNVNGNDMIFYIKKCLYDEARGSWRNIDSCTMSPWHNTNTNMFFLKSETFSTVLIILYVCVCTSLCVF